MSKSTIVVFMVDDEFDSLYFTTPEKFSNVLDKHNIIPDRVKFLTVTIEGLMLILDNQVDYLLRNY